MFQSGRDCFPAVNVALPTVDDWDISQSQRNNPASKNINNVGSLVHQIDLGENADCPLTCNRSEKCKIAIAERTLTIGINFPSQLQTIRIGQVRVCSGNRQNYGIGLLNLLQHHLSDLSLNIHRLISNRYFCQSRQIHQRQRQDTWRKYPETNWFGRNSNIFSRFGLSFLDNLFANLIKVEELLAGNVKKLSPLISICGGVGYLKVGDAIIYSICFWSRGTVDKLEDL